MFINSAGVSITLLLLSIGLNGCLSEANFQLAPESRLPKWFEVPEDFVRSEYEVSLDTYVRSSGPESVFKLFRRGNIFHIEKWSGSPDEIIGSPKAPPVYAAYTFHGITDVVEHKKNEPVFYMCDDPVIWKKLGLQK